jgi:hypothetical protein
MHVISRVLFEIGFSFNFNLKMILKVTLILRDKKMIQG